MAPVLNRVMIDSIGLDLVDRHRGAAVVLELEQSAQLATLARQAFHLVGVLLVDVLLLGLGGVLEQEDGFRGEQVQFALAPVGVLAADVEALMHPVGRVVRVGAAVPLRGLLGEHVEVDAAEFGGGAGEVLVEQRLGEAEGLEGLRGGVGADGRDAHLGHDLQNALDQRLHVVAHRDARSEVGDGAVRDQVLDGFEGQVGVDGGGAVAEQQRDVVHLAGVAGLHDERGAQPVLGADQMVVHRGNQQQRRDRREPVVGVAVGEHQGAGTRRDRLGCLPAYPFDRSGKRLSATVRLVESGKDGAAEAGEVAVVVDVDEFRELVVVDDWVAQLDVAAGGRTRFEQVLLGAHDPRDRGDDLLADRVQRRVGHLREVLLEVVVEQPGSLGEHGGRRVRAHRADRLGALLRHRREQDAQFLFGVAEGELAALHGFVRLHHVFALGEVVQLQQTRVQPLVVGLLARPVRP